MTNKKSDLNDNDGICESCNDPSTKGSLQTTVSVFLGGGLGWGTMWVCYKCLEKRRAEGKSTQHYDTKV